jgi:hypothetical protein
MGLADNDVTRMTRAQLADRIHQMEATASRNSTVGAPRDRNRPMEDRRRRDKIYAYQEELARRIAADAAQAQADAREHDQTPQPEKEKTPVHINDFARAEESYRDDPDIQQLRDDQRAASANARFQRDTYTDEQGSPSDPPCTCQCDGDQADASDCDRHSGRIPRVALQGPTPVIAPPRKARRTRAARPAKQPAAGPDAPQLPELDRAVEALVARYTCGSVIDAAWEASHRLFRPGQTKGGAA